MKMKKVVSMLLVAACTMGLAACGGSSDSGSAEDNTLVMATNAEFPPYEYHGCGN